MKIQVLKVSATGEVKDVRTVYVGQHRLFDPGYPYPVRCSCGEPVLDGVSDSYNVLLLSWLSVGVAVLSECVRESPPNIWKLIGGMEAMNQRRDQYLPVGPSSPWPRVPRKGLAEAVAAIIALGQREVN